MLSAYYGKVQALTRVDLEVRPASVVTVIGPNGAGKSTLLNAIMGLRRTEGAVVYGGKNMGHTPAEQRLAHGLCLVTEGRDLFGTMSVRDNLELGFYSHRHEGRERMRVELARVFALFPRLGERERQLAHTLSGGERQMLVLGRALMARPRLLMLDEPSLGLAPLVVREVFASIVQLRREGVAILLVEQNARAALEVADYGYVLEMGAVRAQGPAGKLAGDRRIVESYLGAGSGATRMRPTVAAQAMADPPIRKQAGLRAA